MSDEATYALVISFPDGTPSFTNGFEAGGFHERMKAGETPIEHIAHIANEEVLRRLADVEGYSVEWTPCGDGCWANIVLRKVKPAGRHNPHGLRAVE